MARYWPPITGQKYGRWTVGGLTIVKSGKQQRTKYLCTCDCGSEVLVYRSALVTGRSTSCGCRQADTRRLRLVPIWQQAREANKIVLGKKRWAQILHGAQKRGIEVAITREQAQSIFDAQSGRCALTGWPIFFPETTSERWTASLDRRDSTRGYVPGNVQWVHGDVNLAKQSFSEERFLEICRTVTAYAGMAQAAE